jgi:polar amino acid transport system substrate-binding protein
MTKLKSFARKVAGIVLAAGLIAGTQSAALALTPEEVKAKGKIVVGVLIDFPPFGGTDANQKPAGYDIDVAKLMAAELGVQVEIVPVTGPNRIPYLLTNRIDVLVAALGITPERAKQVVFSNPYSTLEVMVMAPKKLEIREPKDLAKYTVGVTRAGSQDTLVTSVAPQGTRILRYDDDAISLQAIVAGQVEVLGGSNIHLARLVKDHPNLNIEQKFPLRAQANGVGLRKGDTALTEWTNKFIAKILANGQLSEIHERWLGTKVTQMPPMPKFE